MFKKTGFSLVELLVVLVIVGILVALILPNTLNAIKQANTKECASNIRSIDTATQMYYTENRAWPADVAALASVFPDNTTPVCPFSVAYALVGDAANGYKCDKTGHFAAGNWPNTHE